MTAAAAPMSVEAKLVTLVALGASALTGTLVADGRARAWVAVGGAVMTVAAGWSMFRPGPARGTR